MPTLVQMHLESACAGYKNKWGFDVQGWLTASAFRRDPLGLA